MQYYGCRGDPLFPMAQTISCAATLSPNYGTLALGEIPTLLCSAPRDFFAGVISIVVTLSKFVLFDQNKNANQISHKSPCHEGPQTHTKD